MRIPEGLIAVKPTPKADWRLEPLVGAYAHSYDHYGEELGEGVTEIIWTGSLPDDHHDEFAFCSELAEGLAAGADLYVPVMQECGDKASRWIGIPAAGQDVNSLEHPAPGLRLLPAAAGGH